MLFLQYINEANYENLCAKKKNINIFLYYN